ncbi:MAG: carbamoyltransferase [Clostridium sp.]|nr:carbamoyltransferase [Ruminococcus flavefaciens]MCM1500676.1 carbamoyltransferase [Clostridium sp.]
MYILGISALYHDSAAALIKDGKIVAAAQEERFTRIKADPRIPANAIKYCLDEGKIKDEDIDAVVYYDNPMDTLDRFIHNAVSVGNKYESVVKAGYQSLFESKLWIHELTKSLLPGYFNRGRKLFVTKHHVSHAASAFFPSPFHEATIITIDGVGEWNTTTIACGQGNRIKMLKEINYPHSIGLLYSAFTYFCGFKVNFGDYKLMGLAPYGEPKYAELIKKELIDIKEDGSFRLNLKYFDYQNGGAMTSEAFDRLFGGSRRIPEEAITKREMDMAASVQKVVEEVMIKLAKHAAEISPSKNLVLAGGVALNCVANGKLARENIFDNIWVQPAAGDAGGALGAALAVYYGYFKADRKISYEYGQKGSYWGPEFNRNQIKAYLVKNEIPFEEYEKDENYYDKIAELLAAEEIIGLFQGRMEYGPRALGNRSIIADPRNEKMQAKLNISIKHRESFRPFAPSVLEEKCPEYFDMTSPSPYMLFCADVINKMDTEFPLDKVLEKNGDMITIINRKRSNLPAITHVDYSARIQTVNERDNEDYYKIIKAFEKKTGCGVLINTSFNVRGEPIVCTPEDAYNCFMNTGIDILILDGFILYKEQQSKENYRRDVYELD